MRGVLRLIISLAGLCFVGTLFHALAILRASPVQISPLGAAAFMTATFLAIVAELKPTRLPFGTEVFEVTLSTAVALPVLILVGWPFAFLLMAFAVAVSDIQLAKPWYKTLYNAANSALSVWIAGNVYGLLTGSMGLESFKTSTLAAAAASGLTFSLTNTLLLVLPIATVQGLPYRTVFPPYFKAVAPFYGGVTSLSVAVAVLWQLNPFSVVLLLPALLTTRLAYHHYVRLRLETDNFVESLADAVDLRDPYTAGHSVRVAELAHALGKRLGRAGDELWALRSIARVHDVGKLTVPDAVLLKAGVLTPEEFSQMKGHVEAGVRILQHISLHRSALDILAQHHERLDGSGYPHGLRGDEIIFPARILAVADAYDAMTTDRPYRPAKTPEEAVRELYRVAGKQYDLSVVRALEDELLARGVFKKPAVPAALQAAARAEPEQEPDAAGTARVVHFPRVGSGRKPP